MDAVKVQFFLVRMDVRGVFQLSHELYNIDSLICPSSEGKMALAMDKKFYPWNVGNHM